MAESKEEIDEIYNDYIENGYEGAMIRNDKPYIWGKRVSDRLFKYKPQFDDEFKLVSFEEGGGKMAGTMIWIFETKKGLQFKSTPTGTLAVRKKLFKEITKTDKTDKSKSGFDKYKGKFYTVHFYGYSTDGIPIQSNTETPLFNKHDGGI